VAMPCRAQRNTTNRGGSGKQGSYQEIQEDEAELVANSDGSRCKGASAISRRSPVYRTVRSGRGCYQRSGAQLRKERCEGDAL
jgi:hypothetical protein